MVERNTTKQKITSHSIPKSAVAEIAGLSKTEISQYLYGHTVSTANCSRIENAVADISDLIEFMREHFSLRPDLRDVSSLKAAIAELKAARACVAAQAQLQQTQSEVATALKELASSAF